MGEALDVGFRQDTAEKVARLLDLLRALEEDRSTRGRFTLKGGTALNVFHLPDVPRLSVDIDLMVTGVPDAAPRTPARERITDAVVRVTRQSGYQVTIDDTEVSGCTLHLHYRNGLGSRDQIKIDLDFLNRMTLAPTATLAGPAIFRAQDLEVNALSRAELFGSKLTAVAYRHHERDIYDMHRMIKLGWQMEDRSRALYLGYSFMIDPELYRLDYPTRLAIAYDGERLKDVLRESDNAPPLDEVRTVASQAIGTHPDYGKLLDGEKQLHERLLRGDATAFGLLCGETDSDRLSRLETHPGLRWRMKQLEGRESP